MNVLNWLATLGSGPAPRRRVAWLGGGFIAVVAALAAYDIVRGYRVAVEETRVALDTQSRVIAEQTARSVQAVDTVLRHLAEQHRRGQLDRLDRDALHAYLKEQTVGLVQVDGLVIFNPDGSARGASIVPQSELDKLNVANLPAFLRLRDRADTGLAIGTTFLSTSTGRHVFPIGRRLVTAQGEFAGVVGAGGRIDYFQSFYRDAYPDPGTRIALLYRDGTLLARHPPADAALGKRLEALESLLPAADGAATSTRGVSPVDGTDRFASIRRVPDYPLVVVVTRDARSVLAPWREQATGSALRTLALAAFAAWLIAFAVRHLARLRESEERFAVAVEGADDGIWVWNFETGKAYASERARELANLPDAPEVQSIDAWHEMMERQLHPDDTVRRRTAIDAHIDGLTPAYESEYRMRTPQGGYRWLRVRGMCVRDENGKPLRMAGSSSDIDARKRAEEALRVSEERYALAMTGSNEGHWLWNIPEQRIYVSEKLAELFGFAGGAQEMVDAEYFAGIPIHADDAERVHRNRSNHVAGLTPRLDHEFRIVDRATGEIRWVHTRAQCFRDEAGRPQWLAGATIEVTQRKRAEEALRESEERFAVAVAGSADGIWVFDFGARTAYASERAREIFGAGWPELQSIDEWDARMERRLDPADAERRRATLAAHMAGETPFYELEYRVREPDGRPRWIRARGKCVRDAEGRPVRFAGSVSDIDEKKRAEEALRTSEERYAIAITGSHEGHWVWDPATNEVHTSKLLNELFGLPPETEVTSLDEFYSRWPMHPEDRPRVEAAVREHLAGASPRLDAEYRIVSRETGQVRWVHSRAMLFRDADGKPPRMGGATVEVTERRLAEEALRRSEERYQLAVEGSNEGLWDWDLPSDMLFLSPRAQLLVFADATEPATRPRREWVALTTYHPEDVATVRRALSAHLRGQTPHFSVEYRVQHHFGEWRWYRQRGIAVRDANGRPYRMAGSMEDISVRKNAEGERARLEQELRQAQKLEAIGTLAGGIAHDFNNILSAILGYGEMVQREAGAGTPMRRHIDAAMSAGMRAKSLVERILAFSRGGVGEKVPVHVPSAVEEALRSIAASLPDSVRLQRRLAAVDAGVLGDATQIHQVVMNLCANAAHAMRAGGVLTVGVDSVRLESPRLVATSTLPAGRYVELAVGDTGSGIAPQLLDRIFDPFFTTKEVGVGTGLGLSLVHGIVTDLGGGIAVDSRVGHGTTFTVYLPWHDYVAAPAQADESVVPGDGETVLLVDDEEALVRLGEETLAELGYEPVGFASSVAALAAFREAPDRFDAVLTDEAMPGMTGLELAREVRRLRPDVPIVLMSGFVDATIANRAREAGVADVLTKPLVSRDIARSLAAALRREATPEPGE